jgi:hypothetical protein
MKVEIITYYYSNNYGAVLQAESLKKFVTSNSNYSVTFSKYTPKKLFFREHYKPLLKKNIFHFIQSVKKYFAMKKWKKKNNIEKPIHNKITLNNDLSIYGSDEIWNFSNPFFGYDPFFFGELNSSKKISYAASIGNADIKKITSDQKSRMKQLLNSFYYISVRDENSYNFVYKITNRKPDIVVDPIFLTDDEDNNVANLYGALAGKEYALVYGNYFFEEEQKKIINFCKKNKVELISIGYINNWIKKNNLNINPDEFKYYVKNAKFVFTSMFHGVMFSVKYNKQFWFTQDPYRKNKLEYFLDYLNLKPQLLNSSNNLDKLINYEPINDNLSKWIGFSKKNLLNQLNSKRL